MWTYLGARKSEKRNDLSIWTTVVEERDGSGRIDFEVVDRDESTFLRLPERYETDAYGVYGDAADQQACGWEARRGELERQCCAGS